MRLGIANSLEKLQETVTKGKENGIDNFRVDLSLSMRSIRKYSKIINKTDAEFYIVFTDSYEDLIKDWGKSMEKLEKFLDLIESENVAAVSLIGDCHKIVRRGTSRRGVRKDVLIKNLNEMSNVIRDRGMPVALPSMIDDIQSDFWKGVDKDVFDVELFLDDKGFDIVSVFNGKPFIAGLCGRRGGYINKTVERMFTKKLKMIDNNISIAFLKKDEGRFNIFQEWL